MTILRIPPLYRITKTIISHLGTIEANNEIIKNFVLPAAVEDNIKRKSILGSALFSARIEGNPLTVEEVAMFSSLSKHDLRVREVANLRRAINFVLQRFTYSKKITRGDILKLHTMTMSEVISGEYLGRFRTGHEGIFDSYGNLIYHAPPPSQIISLTEKFLQYVNGRREKLIPIKAVLSHLIFEKIHPFVDGSGRVGRLLQLAVLSNMGYAMRGFASVEEEIDRNRQSYYSAIENARGTDATEFVELMLEFIAISSTKAREEVLSKKDSLGRLDFLLPRRQEIANIILEHRLVSLDFLHRRFLKVSRRQMAYDLEALIKDGFIAKIGKTRGALYAPKS